MKTASQINLPQCGEACSTVTHSHHERIAADKKKARQWHAAKKLKPRKNGH